jgi:hypothetical protein
MFALVPLSLGPAVAEEPHPNPDAALNQWQSVEQQRSIDTLLRSAGQHAAAGAKDAAVADYRQVLSLAPNHPDAVTGLKALGLDDASIAAPLKLPPSNGSPSGGGPSPAPPSATGGGGGGGIFPNGIQ